jgi:hypothetical protein
MTRANKIRKLGNAIREYRGRYHGDSGKWIDPPKPTAYSRILHWLGELKLPDINAALDKIDNFKTFDEMRQWLSAL